MDDEEWYQAYLARRKRRQDSLARQEADEAEQEQWAGLASETSSSSERRPEASPSVHPGYVRLPGFRKARGAAPNWPEHALCRGLPVDWFHPDHGTSNQDIDRARAVCLTPCPVRMECLLTGLINQVSFQRGNPSRTGIRGGYIMEQQIAIKQALRPRSPESLSVGELATFIETYVPKPRGRPKKSA